MRKKILIFIFVFSIVIGSITVFCLYNTKRNFYNSLNGTLFVLNSENKVVKYDSQNGKEVLNLKNFLPPEAGYFDCVENQLYVVCNDGKYADAFLVDKNGTKKICSLTYYVYSGVFKDDKLYVIKSEDEVYQLCAINLLNGEQKTICALQGYAPLYCSNNKIFFDNGDTVNNGETLYFLDSWFYYDGISVKACPDSVKAIVAANDGFVASYDKDADMLEVFNSTTWEKVYSVGMKDKPYNAVFSPDSTKLIYCIMDDKDLFAGNTSAFHIVGVADLLRGKVYKSNLGKNKTAIHMFLSWVD